MNNQTWHTLRAYHGNLRELYLLSKENIKYYSISASHDDQTCIHCKGMDGKKFRVSDAIKGVNFPPFCKYCRCVILPVIPNPTHNKYFSYMRKKQKGTHHENHQAPYSYYINSMQRIYPFSVLCVRYFEFNQPKRELQWYTWRTACNVYVGGKYFASDRT